MNKDSFVVATSNLPNWMEYPHSFHRIVDQGLVDITPWHILDGQRVLVLFQKLKERYASREIFPFAYRQDNDDVACWSKGRGEKVFVVHDFASPGWEDEAEFDDVWSWFRSAVDETIAWD